MAIATSRAGRNLTATGSDDERSQGGRHVPNDAPTVPSSVLDQDIAGRQHHLRTIVELECHVAGEKDPEIRRVGPVKAVVSSAGFVAILEVHLGSGFWCNHAGQVRPYDVADATYGWEYTGRRRIVPRVRVGCGLIGIPEEGELSYARDGRPINLLVSHKNSPALGVMAGDNRAYLHSLSLLVRLVYGHVLGLLVRRTPLTASPCSSPGKRPNIAVSVGPGLRVFTRIPRSTSSALRM